jgi:hypothetical protein
VPPSDGSSSEAQGRAPGFALWGIGRRATTSGVAAADTSSGSSHRQQTAPHDSLQAQFAKRANSSSAVLGRRSRGLASSPGQAAQQQQAGLLASSPSALRSWSPSFVWPARQTPHVDNPAAAGATGGSGASAAAAAAGGLRQGSARWHQQQQQQQQQQRWLAPASVLMPGLRVRMGIASGALSDKEGDCLRSRVLQAAQGAWTACACG